MPNPEHLFNQAVTRRSTERATDGQGGFDETQASAISFRGRISPASAADITLGAQIQVRATHALYCPFDSGIIQGDSVFDESSEEYEVKHQVKMSQPDFAKWLLEIDRKDGA